MKLVDSDVLTTWIKESQKMTSKVKAILCYIETMPSQNRPNGEWLCSDDSYENAICSNCGFDSGESYVVVKYKQKWKACPVCEARMRGGDDETD